MPQRPDASKPCLCFLLPDGSEHLSGGNLYNQALARTLASQTQLECASIQTLESRLLAGTPGVYLIDTLDLARAPALSRRAPGQYFGLLVHHLPSLEPCSGGASDEELAREDAALSMFDFLIATSHFTRTLLLSRGYQSERVLTVRPGLAESLRCRPLRGSSRQLHALVVGNLIPRKGVVEWLGALSTRLQTDDDFRLSFAGRDDLDVSYAVACKAFVARHPQISQRVSFLGAVPHPHMAALLGAASLLVSPSNMETFGIALQEARALGVPILALDRGNAREHVAHDMNGLLCSSHDELASEFLALTRAPDRLAAFSARAQAAAMVGEDWPSVARRFLLDLESLASTWR